MLGNPQEEIDLIEEHIASTHLDKGTLRELREYMNALKNGRPPQPRNALKVRYYIDVSIKGKGHAR